MCMYHHQVEKAFKVEAAEEAMRAAEADLAASRKACPQLEAQLRARDRDAAKVQKAAEAARGEAWEAEALRAQVRRRRACRWLLRV